MSSRRTTSHLTLVYDYYRDEQNGNVGNKPKGRAHMPKATVDTSTTERYDLKTLPEGFVDLRRMSYGEYLHRRDMISNMSFKGQGENTEAFMKMANEEVAHYEFMTCIVDHNLEDANDKPLDFRKKSSFKVLDPRIGEEISSYIDKMNKWEEDEDGDPLPNSDG